MRLLLNVFNSIDPKGIVPLCALFFGFACVQIIDLIPLDTELFSELGSAKDLACAMLNFTLYVCAIMSTNVFFRYAAIELKEGTRTRFLYPAFVLSAVGFVGLCAAMYFPHDALLIRVFENSADENRAITKFMVRAIEAAIDMIT